MASTTEQILKTVESWEQIARSRFADAAATTEPTEKRGIETSAMCYYNCAQEIRAILASPLPEPLYEEVI